MASQEIKWTWYHSGSVEGRVVCRCIQKPKYKGGQWVLYKKNGSSLRVVDKFQKVSEAKRYAEEHLSEILSDS